MNIQILSYKCSRYRVLVKKYTVPVKKISIYSPNTAI